MSNRQCPKCGEEYSDTYRKCPFCEEEEASRRGKPLRRHGGKRLSKKKRSSGAGGVMLSVMAVVIIGVVGYVYFGEQVASFMGIRSVQPDAVSTDPGANISNFSAQPEGHSEDDRSSVPDGDGTDAPAAPDAPDPAVPAGPLALDHDAITIPAGETARLAATGGTGEVTWSTSNENIATVDGGAITGKAGGTVTVTAAAGEESVSCTVTVTGDPWVNPIAWTLNKTDVTERSGGNGFQLKVKDCTSPIVWASENPAVASVDSQGWVVRTGKGTTNITASVDGQVLKCIVRCP